MTFELNRRSVLTGASALGLTGFALPAWAQGGSKLIEKRESKYNTIYILEEPNGNRGMIFGVNRRLFTESLYNPSDPKELPVTYTRYMTVALTYPLALRNVLEIGLGGGRTASYLNLHAPEIAITSVELDPDVIALAKQYFGVKEGPNLKLVAKDGRLFLRQSNEKFDLIMIDAYRGTFVPFHLLTKEFFQMAKTRLSPGGVVAQNIEPTTMLYDGAIATLRSTFANVDVYPASGNVVAIAYDGARPSTAALAQRAAALQAKYNFRHPLPELLGVREAVEGPLRARALTDDFAPVEALRATERHNAKRAF